MDKKQLSEADICRIFITPSLKDTGCNIHKQVRKEVLFLDGRIGKFVVPILPLARNKRIANKVDELLGLCEELEKGLIKSRESLEKVLKSIVSGME